MSIFKESYYKDLNNIYNIAYALEDYINRYGIDNKILIESSIKEIFNSWGTFFKKIFEKFLSIIEKIFIFILNLTSGNLKFVTKNEKIIKKIKQIIKKDHNNNLQIDIKGDTNINEGFFTTIKMINICRDYINELGFESFIYNDNIDFNNCKHDFIQKLCSDNNQKDDDYLSILQRSFYSEVKTSISAEDIDNIVSDVKNKKNYTEQINFIKKGVNDHYNQIKTFLKQQEKNISKTLDSTETNIIQKRFNECMEYSKFIFLTGTNISQKSIELIYKSIKIQTDNLKNIMLLVVVETTD